MILPTGVSLSASTASIWSWVEYQLEAYIVPELASNNKIHWSASNNNVTVDENGLVTWVTDGTSVVTATTDYGGYTASCTFTVFTVPVTWVSLDTNKLTLTPWKTYQLTATITPSNATNKKVTWRSTDTSVAVVDNNGLVTCIDNGDAEIIVTTADWNYTDSCEIITKRTPWENTISYFPFREDFADHKWNRTLTVNDCTIDNGSAKINSQSSYMTLSSTIWWSDITINLRYYYWAYSTWWWWNTLFARKGWTYHHLLIPATSSSWTVWQVGFYNSWWYPWNEVLQLWEWYNIIVVKSWNNQKIYINSKLVEDSNSSFNNNSYPIWIIANYDSWQSQWAQGRMSELFFENKLWTQEEIDEYFNMSKAEYWYDISAYDELEYIQSDWNQYINTLYIPKVTSWFDINFEVSSKPWSYNTILWTRYDTANNAFWIWHQVSNWQSYWEFSPTNTHPLPFSFSTLNTKYTLTFQNSNLDKTLSDWTNNYVFNFTQNSSYNLYLFCWNQRDSWLFEPAGIKMYYCKIYDNLELVRDFIPVKRKSDWELWLFDKVEQKFYKNKWSWAFTAWPKIWVILNSNSISLTSAWQTYQLTATANPSSIWSQGYRRKSSDTTIATVSNSWLVTCVTPGECTITCTAIATGDVDTCSVITIEEYVLLSEWGSINKFSELAKSDNNTYTSLYDEWTRRRAQVWTTDKCTSMYKNFDKNIVKFDILFQYTENYSYSWVYFNLQPTVWSSDLWEAWRFEINNWQDTYSWWSWIKFYRWTTWTSTTISSWVTTADVRVVWERSWTTWTLTFTWWKNFTYTFDETNDCKRISFGWWRRWTWTQWYFKKVVVYLA